jgi:hypothetical protein
MEAAAREVRHTECHRRGAREAFAERQASALMERTKDIRVVAVL